MQKLIKELRLVEKSARQHAERAKGTQRLRLVGLADTLKAQANSLDRETSDEAQRPTLASLRMG